MSMTVQDAGTCSNFFTTVTTAASSTASWLTKTMQTFGSNVADYAQKAVEVSKPHFDNLKTLASENRGPIMIAVIAAAVGAALYAIISNVFCSRAVPAQQPQQTPPPGAEAVRA